MGLRLLPSFSPCLLFSLFRYRGLPVHHVPRPLPAGGDVPFRVYRVRLPQRGAPMQHVPCPSPAEGDTDAACTVSVSRRGGH